MAWYHLIPYNPYDRKEWYQNIKLLCTNKKYLYQFGKIKKKHKYPFICTVDGSISTSNFLSFDKSTSNGIFSQDTENKTISLWEKVLNYIYKN